MDVLALWGPGNRVLNLELPHPNVRRHSPTIEANCRASYRIIIWGNHPLVMKPCLAIGFLQFALSLIRKEQIVSSFDIRFSCSLL